VLLFIINHSYVDIELALCHLLIISLVLLFNYAYYFRGPSVTTIRAITQREDTRHEEGLPIIP
jgi:hypothetical protein